MPKLQSRIQERPVAEGRSDTFCQVSFSGFIDAANYAAFERALDDVYQRGGRFAVADFSALNYINSTGISALIRLFGQFKERNGVFCLVSVPKPVGLSMHLLGVTSLIPFLKDVDAARLNFLDVLEGRVQVPVGAEIGGEVVRPSGASVFAPPGGGSSGGAEAVERRRIPIRRSKQLADAKVLLLHPSKSRFSRILRRRFSRLNGHFHLVHDVKEALDRYEELNPDLVVLDDCLDPKGDFVTRLKINKSRSLTSVIKIYEKARDVEGEIDFKIWENDYLVDPFDALELFSLTEAELLRVPRDRKVFQQQVHFEFRSNNENIEKATKLSDFIIRQSIENEEDQTALYAAVKEAIDNGVVHGNNRSMKQTIDVNFLVDQHKVTVLVEDQGRGFDFEYYLSRIDSREAFEKAKRRILEEGHRGGLGILLMHKCCDRLEYSGSGNVVRLEKNIPGR